MRKHTIMQNYTTILGIIDMRQRVIFYDDCRSRYKVGCSTITLIMRRFKESCKDLDMLRQIRLLLEDIAKTCVESNACRYSYFKKLLKNMQDNHSVPTISSLPEHSNLRGKEEYR